MSLFDFLVSPAAAQSAAAPPGGGFGIFIPIALFALLMWVMVLRPQSKRQKEHRDLIAKLGKGDEIITSGGIAGRVDNIGDGIHRFKLRCINFNFLLARLPQFFHC